MATPGSADRPTGSSARLQIPGRGDVNVDTGIPVLDHLVVVLARYARFDLALEVAPAGEEAEVAAAGRALGEALAAPLRAASVRGYGEASVPADEALAHVALEASEQPLLVSNVDLSDAHVAGVERDVVATFLNELADGAGLTLHVRLIGGEDAQNVLEAIFKTLGVALGEACTPT
ncbi:MAG: imidazoleglycerol-phosphate dehydratase [Actinomycetota bacterium]|nr:imidazoleglycerol-phosphate dehydratase [Actinomycetota bacterium]